MESPCTWATAQPWWLQVVLNALYFPAVACVTTTDLSAKIAPEPTGTSAAGIVALPEPPPAPPDGPCAPLAPPPFEHPATRPTTPAPTAAPPTMTTRRRDSAP